MWHVIKFLQFGDIISKIYSIYMGRVSNSQYGLYSKLHLNQMNTFIRDRKLLCGAD